MGWRQASLRARSVEIKTAMELRSQTGPSIALLSSQRLFLTRVIEGDVDTRKQLKHPPDGGLETVHNVLGLFVKGIQRFKTIHTETLCVYELFLLFVLIGSGIAGRRASTS